ncbi:hypothetical protein APHAL10511_005814 [Amanita phalloides]|nr:hypothetical protein APHAL10511_005814 [Amanita phalloides]
MKVASTFIGRWFLLDGCGKQRQRSGSRFTTEIRAGLTTWAAMAYIISVNASIISDTGGTCVCTSSNNCANDVAYLSCVGEVKQDLITTTAAICALASCLIGLLANFPVGLGPGLGLNVYFAFAVVGHHGSGMITYREALGAVFMSGWIFLFLSLVGLRQWLARIMPQSLIFAICAGIGLFIAFIGLSSSGLGVVGGSTSTYVTLGGCLPQDYVSPDLVGYCNGRVLRSPTMWLGIFLGGVLTVLLMTYRVQGAILIGIFLTAIVSWPRSTAVTYFPRTAAGDEMFDFFKQIVTFRKLKMIGNVIDYNYRSPHVWYAVTIFLYVAILDTAGTLYSMANFAGLHDPLTLDFENSTIAYCVNAFCIIIGALMGTSPVIPFAESATGITEGGKTGLTAITIGIAFFISIFFAPIFASIPPWAIGGALVIVGSLMMRNIAYGVVVGIVSYGLLNGIPYLLMKATGGRIMPPDYQIRVTPRGSVLPGWTLKLFGWNKKNPESSAERKLDSDESVGGATESV